MLDRYPEGDWPDWFREVVNDADGLLRTQFIYAIDPLWQAGIKDMLHESRTQAGVSHEFLVEMFEEQAQKTMPSA